MGRGIFLLLYPALLLAHSVAGETATSPLQYVAYRTVGPIAVDGKLDEPSWQRIAWTEDFVDIEGGAEEVLHKTRAKMLWDPEYFYLAADLEEPNVWATHSTRDTTVYDDDDFEIYIDPDGDTHEYYELGINALGTVRDLLLLKPYRDQGSFIQAWDVRGLQSGVQVWGSLNDPSDTDAGWSVEIALPWNVLAECANRPAPPRGGDRWRVNLSRLDWQTGEDPESDKAGRGEVRSWVWSPQGTLDMHLPEKWGHVQFSSQPAGVAAVEATLPPEYKARLLLRTIYDLQRRFRDDHGRYTTDLDSLGLEFQVLRDFLWPPVIQITPTQFEAALEELTDLHEDGRLNRWIIRQDSKLWKQ